MSHDPECDLDGDCQCEDIPEPLVAAAIVEGFRSILRGDEVVAATCPLCGNVPNANGKYQEIRYVEQIEVYRAVVPASASRFYSTKASKLRLIVDGMYHTGEGYDDGVPHTAAFECMGKVDDEGHHTFCGHRWRIPDWFFQESDFDDIGRNDLWEG